MIRRGLCVHASLKHAFLKLQTVLRHITWIRLHIRCGPLTTHWLLAALHRLQGKRGAVVVLNYGLHQSKFKDDPRNSSAIAAATAQQANA